MNMFKLVLALFVVGASAFSPAAGSRMMQSRVVSAAAPVAAEPMAARAPMVAMNAVTEYDADGNPVVQFSMCVAQFGSNTFFNQRRGCAMQLVHLPASC